jgi:hypothetical protein
MEVGMEVNMGKTKVVLFSVKKRSSQAQISFKNEPWKSSRTINAKIVVQWTIELVSMHKGETTRWM